MSDSSTSIRTEFAPAHASEPDDVGENSGGHDKHSEGSDQDIPSGCSGSETQHLPEPSQPLQTMRTSERSTLDSALAAMRPSQLELESRRLVWESQLKDWEEWASYATPESPLLEFDRKRVSAIPSCFSLYAERHAELRSELNTLDEEMQYLKRARERGVSLSEAKRSECNRKTGACSSKACI
ncbi:hypothetical protein IAT40_002886 [Kwoniella sp. CBS 6097]